MPESKGSGPHPFKTKGPSFEPDGSIERLGPYNILILKNTGLKLTQDPLLLLEFMLPLEKEDSVIDLGTGAGVIPVMLAWRSPVLKITGVEVEEKAVEAARRNLEANRLEGRVNILKRDFRELPEVFKEGSFRVVVSNPPYIKAGAGRISPVRERAYARSEILGGLKDLVPVSKHLAGAQGRIFYIFPVARLFEMLDELKRVGLRPKRLKFIHTNPKKTAKLFLIEAGRKGELKIEEPAFL